ncbi:MAG TPA: hypothetical protein VM055_04295 [Novosphingobium sp.]|nr:hypothetical protein [Novosphingobium sp.]
MNTTHALHRPAGAHPLRQSLRFGELKRRSRRPARFTAQDLREFLMAYCACFMAVSAFIA